MSPALPDGDEAPADGGLPSSVVEGADARAFGVYVHVPFCTVRCGYCDFNTYTAVELGGGASQASYARTARREVDLAARVLRAAGLPERAVSTVFVGGGTPTVLPADDLVGMLRAVRDTWGLAQDVEVTTEANPDSVTPASLAALADAGFTRVSFGMQSAVPHVLRTLERTHDPARIGDVVSWARDAGLDVSLDLIYGTPGESLEDWRTSLEAALATGVDHVSAYALVVEEGTRMAVQVRRGSSSCRTPTTRRRSTSRRRPARRGRAGVVRGLELGARCPARVPAQPRVLAWRRLVGDRSGRPRTSGQCAGGTSSTRVPTPHAWRRGSARRAGREVIDDEAAALERLMLHVRLAEGMPLQEMTDDERSRVAALVADQARRRPHAADPATAGAGAAAGACSPTSSCARWRASAPDPREQARGRGEQTDVVGPRRGPVLSDGLCAP